MEAKIRLKNTTMNQEIARKIKEANREAGNALDISFKKDLTEIFFEGEQIIIPEKSWFSDDMLVKGQAKERNNGIEIVPKDRGKTVNLHLDAELVSELNEIKNHVTSKTQHDIILELFKKGLDQYNKENK
ncbi:MAG TPA: hypothetical protein VEY51_11920 [Chondromyces sp.]|nr:hypothetical protein [Chondromyces sp.]